MQDRKVKVVVIGSIGVGKTSITQRYIYNQFNPKSESTLGATYGEKVHLYDGNKMLKFQLWDTAGQQKYRAIAKIYYRDCRVAVVVYDVTNRDTFIALKKWIEELKANGPEKVLIAIVGNKIDLAHSSATTAGEVTEEVSYEQAYEYANKVDAIFKLVSAKQNQGIQDLFNVIATRHDIMFQGQKQSKPQTLNSNKSKKKNNCC